MYKLAAITLLLSVVSLEAGGASHRRAIPAPIDPDAVTISFTQAGGWRQTTYAALELGNVSRRGRERAARSIERIAVRINRTSGIPGGTASLRAFLENEDGRSIIRVDGVPLGAAPILIDAHAPIGAAVAHRIEIEIPPAVPAGVLASSIGWEVTTN